MTRYNLLVLKVSLNTNKEGIARPQSRSLESQRAGLQFLWLARRLKPWLETIDGL